MIMKTAAFSVKFLRLGPDPEFLRRFVRVFSEAFKGFSSQQLAFF